MRPDAARERGKKLKVDTLTGRVLSFIISPEDMMVTAQQGEEYEIIISSVRELI